MAMKLRFRCVLYWQFCQAWLLLFISGTYTYLGQIVCACVISQGQLVGKIWAIVTLVSQKEWRYQVTFQLTARISSKVNFLITVSSLLLACMCQQIRSLERLCFLHWNITNSLNPIWRNSRWLPWVNWGDLDWVGVCVIGLSSFQISCSCHVFTESNGWLNLRL